MTFVKHHYEVKVELVLSVDELDYLIKLALQHYDSKCQMAGRQCGEPGTVNGFLVIALMSEKLYECNVIWSSREIDTCLKILELPDTDTELRTTLIINFNRLLGSLSFQYRQLNSK